MLDVIKKLIVLQDRDQKIFRTKTELRKKDLTLTGEVARDICDSLGL